MTSTAINILPFLGLRTPFSSASHFLGCLVALVLTAYLWRAAHGERRRQLVLGCFGLSAMLLYGASATYHALVLPFQQLVFFQLLDHSAIYLLIAGTYTPTVVVLMRRSLLKDTLIASVWGLALAGIACKWLIFGAPYWVTVTPYLALGWIGVVALPEIKRSVGWRGLGWIFAGGMSYSVGAVLDLQAWPTILPGVFGSHELFHVLTLLGTLCHFLFMVKYVVPHPRTVPSVALEAALPAAGAIRESAALERPSLTWAPPRVRRRATVGLPTTVAAPQVNLS